MLFRRRFGRFPLFQRRAHALQNGLNEFAIVESVLGQENALPVRPLHFGRLVFVRVFTCCLGWIPKHPCFVELAGGNRERKCASLPLLAADGQVSVEQLGDMA